MRIRPAALAALVVACSVPMHAHADAPLTLDDAYARVLAGHPDLESFRPMREATEAEVETAVQTPPRRVITELENVTGSGARSGVDAAEVTISLASVFERGDKRAARGALARARLDAFDNEREAKRLDLLAEVARRYLDVVAAEATRAIGDADVDQRERAVAAATRRVQAGASPESVRLAAEAEHARARLERDRALRERDTALRRLALLWGARDVPGSLATHALAIPAVPTFDAIARELERNPDLRRFSDAARLREARLQLARSARAADIDWQVGVRRLQEGSDWALTGSLSIPLGSASRASAGIRTAEAELALLDLERASGELTLLATLAEAHGRLASQAEDARQWRDDVLPRLAKAESSAAHAYRAGALDYLEWSQLQAQVVLARRQQLAATVDAQRALIEIQRLTANGFDTAAARTTEILP